MGNLIPSLKNIQDAFTVARTVDAVMHAVHKLKSKFESIKFTKQPGIDPQVAKAAYDEKVETLKKLISLAEKRALLVCEERDGRLSPFEVADKDLEVLSDFENLQNNKTKQTAPNLASNDRHIKMDCAVSDESNFVRTCGDLDKNEILKSGINTLFNAWLVEQGMVCKDTIIYQRDEKGNPLVDENGNKVRVSPEALRQLIQDKEKGPEKFFKERGIDLSTEVHPYPEEKAAEKPVVSTVEKEVVAERPKAEVKEEVTPTPTTGPGI